MIENSYYSRAQHGDYDEISIGTLDLEAGGRLPDCRLAVATFGRLNPARDNAILVTTWYSGTHQMLRDVYIGPGHALDPERYFIVVVNQIGNGLSSSPHNATGEAAMSGFPKVRIGDDVVAQERLLRQRYGIEELQLVVGGSMGAQQTYEWAVRFPDKVKRAAPIAGTARITPHNVLVTDLLIDAIRSDPGWNAGEYAKNSDVGEGLRRLAKVFSVLGFSCAFWQAEAWRALGFDSMDAFQTGFVEPYFGAMDPNALLTMAGKWRHGDVARHTGGDLAAALGRITARTSVLPISEDMLFPVRDCAAEQALIPTSELHVIDNIGGHLGLFGLEPSFVQQVDQHLTALLATPA